MKRAAIIAMLLGVLVILNAIINTPSLPSEQPAWVQPTVAQMADTTVTIISEYPCENPHCDIQVHESWGSGVLVGEGTVLTARHLFKREGRVASYVLFMGERYLVSDILIDPDSDLAVICVDNMPEHPVAEIDMNDPPLGADVIMIGTPSHKLMGQRVVKGNISNLDVSELLEEVFKDAPDLLEAWSRVVMTTCMTVHGNSGGPVFYNGKVVGIFVGFPLVRNTIAYNFTAYVPIYELDTPEE